MDMSIFNGVRVGMPVLCVAAAMGLGACASSPLKDANARAVNDQVIEVRAKTPFDTELARRALEPGNSQIVGTVVAIVNAPKSYDPSLSAREFKENVEVYLYPVTPHLREFVDLQKSLAKRPGLFEARRAPGQHKLVADPDMLNFQRVTKTDKYGRYAFTSLKPGQYYVTVFYKHVFYSLQNVRTSTVTDGYGSVGVFKTQEFSEPLEIVMGETITISKDGATEEFNFSQRGIRNFSRVPK